MAGRIVHYGNPEHAQWAIERMGLGSTKGQVTQLRDFVAKKEAVPERPQGQRVQHQTGAKEAFDRDRQRDANSAQATWATIQQMYPNTPILLGGILSHPYDENGDPSSHVDILSE